MSATWAKNEVSATKRGCLLIVTDDGGIPASPGLDFITMGGVFVVGANAPNADLATGTLTNVRRALAFSSFTFTADNTNEQLTKTTHGLETGDGPINVSNAGGALPTGLAAATAYYVIKVDANTLKLATSLSNAYAGTAINLTTNGTGTQTLAAATGCKRGVWGHFWYVATQAETNHDAPEMAVMVDYTGYLRMNGGGAHTSVNMATSAADVWAQTMEGAYTFADGMRILVRGEAAPYSIASGVYTIRDLANSKNSHHGTITGSGRSATAIDDAT